jgi:hypothetical protein
MSAPRHLVIGNVFEVSQPPDADGGRQRHDKAHHTKGQRQADRDTCLRYGHSGFAKE